MIRKLIVILLFFLPLVGFSQSPEQIVKQYVSLLDVFLMSPNSSSKRTAFENAAFLQGCYFKDDIYIKYKNDSRIEDCMAKDYAGLLSNAINANRSKSYANVKISRDLVKSNNGNIYEVTAYLQYSGAIEMRTVTVFHVKDGKIIGLTNDFIRTKEWNAETSTAVVNDNNSDDIIVTLPDLNNSRDQQMLKERARELVKQLNSYISYMTKKSETDQNGVMRPTISERNECMKAALNFFLNNGDSLMLANGDKIAPVMVEVHSVYNGQVQTRTYSVKNYFNRLIQMINHGRNTEVVITSVDVPNMDVSHIEKVGDRYRCFVSMPLREGYSDFMKICVEFEITHTPFGDEIWTKLGNITCMEIKPR